jgi:hypothetical protein
MPELAPVTHAMPSFGCARYISLPQTIGNTHLYLLQAGRLGGIVRFYAE